MGKHTNGPWRIAGKATIRAGDAAWIANVHFANREANAQLIAAAPELLAALEWLHLGKGQPVDVAAIIAKANGSAL